MNLKKWTSVITLCAFTTLGSAAPALATSDTAFVDGSVSSVSNASPDTDYVGQTTPNLQAAANAMAAAMGQVAGSGSTSTNNGSSQPATGDTEVVGIDYVSLDNPAVTIDSQTYLPLRATFSAMKDQALQVDWKAEGQQKLRLSNASLSYEVYLTSGDTGLQLQQGGTTYTLKNVSGVTYVPLAFFQAIIGSANVSLSGDRILVLAAKDGTSVWSSTGFWSNMNAYQAPVVEETPAPAPEVQKPTVSYPDVSTPSGSGSTTGGNSNTGNSTGSGNSNSGTNSGTTGGSTIIDSLIWPASSTYITSDYGNRIDPVGGVEGDFHLGVDIAGSIGDPVYAAQGGTVIRASWFSTYGNCVDVQHPSGLITRYAHLSAYRVSVGDTVTQGQIIAEIGDTGNVTGPHLHFETIVNGNTVDPMSYFS